MLLGYFFILTLVWNNVNLDCLLINKAVWLDLNSFGFDGIIKFASFGLLQEAFVERLIVERQYARGERKCKDQSANITNKLN